MDSELKLRPRGARALQGSGLLRSASSTFRKGGATRTAVTSERRRDWLSRGFCSSITALLPELPGEATNHRVFPVRTIIIRLPIGAPPPTPLKGAAVAPEPGGRLAVPAPTRSMEAARGRLGSEPDLSVGVEHQAATFGVRPSGTPSKQLSVRTLSGEEEAESVGVASRHPRASPKTSSGSIAHRPELDTWEDKPSSRATQSGTGGRRGAPGSEHAPHPSSWYPEPEPSEHQPSALRICRRGSPRGVEMNVELPQQEGEDDDDDDEAAAGRAGRSFPSRLQDSRSLDGLSGACGGGGSSSSGEAGAGGGRRATISSPLELEGTVSRHGDLTHFVANNLQLKIRLSGAPPPLPPASVRPCLTPAPTPTIPPIDPDVLRDLERLSRELGGRVDRLLRGLGGAVQELTALSVGCIQTYRDAVDSLGEAVDMSIKGMYTLLARCEELERALQPVQGLARQVRDIRRTLEVLEALCK